MEPYTDQRLELYLLRDGGASHRCHCNILEFMDHMNRWREAPNPHGILNENTSQIAWKDVVRFLRRVEIDVNRIDLELYQELRACETYNVLANKLLEILELQRNGALEERAIEWKQEGLEGYDEQLKKKAKELVYVGLNSKRFSHAHPKGIDIDELEEMNLTKLLQQRYVEPREPGPVVMQVEPKTVWQLGKGKVTEWLTYSAWRYIVFATILMGGLLGGFAYSQFRLKGCGDDCFGIV